MIQQRYRKREKRGGYICRVGRLWGRSLDIQKQQWTVASEWGVMNEGSVGEKEVKTVDR